MRAHEILLEFNVEKTAEHYGDKLWATLNTRRQGIWRGAVIMPAWKEYSESHKDVVIDDPAQHKAEFIGFIVKKIIEKLKGFDPTNGKYAVWIVKLCSKTETLPPYEDMGRVHDALAQFDTIKKSGYFVRNKDKAQYADINVFKNFRELENFIDSIETGAMMSNSKQDKEIESRLVEYDQAEILFNSDNYKLVIPRSEEAAVFFGRNTRWCTAATKNNMFDHYNDAGPLYIFIDKKNNRRWQLHLSTKQYMDEKDEPIKDWSDFPVQLLHYMDFEFLSYEEIYEILNDIALNHFPVEPLDGIISNCEHAKAMLFYLVWVSYLNKFHYQKSHGMETIKKYVVEKYSSAPMRKEGKVLDYGADGIGMMAYFIKEIDDPTEFETSVSVSINTLHSFVHKYGRINSYHFIVTESGFVVIIAGDSLRTSISFGSQGFDHFQLSNFRESVEKYNLLEDTPEVDYLVKYLMDIAP